MVVILTLGAFAILQLLMIFNIKGFEFLKTYLAEKNPRSKKKNCHSKKLDFRCKTRKGSDLNGRSCNFGCCCCCVASKSTSKKIK